jgi:hypothetical protein
MSASRRVCCSSECCMSRRIELSGFLRPRGGLPISGGPRGSSAETVPCQAFRKAGSSSRELCSRSETIRLSPAVRAVFAATHVRRLPWGLVPLRDVSARSPRPTGFPNPAFGPSSTFLTSSTVYSSSRLAGLFHPTTTSRVSLQGFPPTNQERRLVAVASLLAVGTELLPGCPGASSRCVDLEGLF